MIAVKDKVWNVDHLGRPTPGKSQIFIHAQIYVTYPEAHAKVHAGLWQYLPCSARFNEAGVL